MNTKRLLIAIVASFVLVFVFDFAFHGGLLGDVYKSTAEAWRTEQAMEGLMAWAMVMKFLVGLTFACIFQGFVKSTRLGDGCRFGFFVGLLLGAIQFEYYVYIPIPLTLAVAWLGGAVVEGILLGALNAAIYKPLLAEGHR